MNSPANPFDASRLRPGIVPYYFTDGRSRDELVEQFMRSGYRGQIVGPHGTGKSTLWLEIIESLRATGLVVVTHALRHEPAAHDAILNARGHEILAIDGFEQLRLWRRMSCIYRRPQMRLLITTHRRQPGLPLLHSTSATTSQLRYVAEQLWGERDATRVGFPAVLADQSLREMLDRHGSTREALFSLFDWYQQNGIQRSGRVLGQTTANSKCTGAISPESRD
jgi:hypothetical protein